MSKIREVIKSGQIPKELVINFDQTNVHIVPVEQEGSIQVEIIGFEDKRSSWRYDSPLLKLSILV